jgi:hypothetical protein
LYWVRFQKQAPESVDRTVSVWLRVGSCIVQASPTAYSRVFFAKNTTTAWAVNYYKDPGCDPGWVDVADQPWGASYDATRQSVRWSESGSALPPLRVDSLSAVPVAQGVTPSIDVTLNHSTVGGFRLDAVLDGVSAGSQTLNEESSESIGVGSFNSGPARIYTVQLRDVWSGQDVWDAETVLVWRKPWTITLQDLGSSVKTTTNMAASNLSGRYRTYIYDDTTGAVAKTCASGTTCSVSKVAGHAYVGVVANAQQGDVQAVSDGWSANTLFAQADPEFFAGGFNPASNAQGCSVADPVNCATGMLFEPVTDVSLPGRLCGGDADV